MPPSEPRPTPVTPIRSDRPAVVDEWGIYNPDQAGLAALFDRVEEKRRVSGEPDADDMAASMREANRLADASGTPDARPGHDDDQTPVRGSGRAFLP